jgi:hypothetical protein
MNRSAGKRKQAARCLASVPLGILGTALLAASAWSAPAVQIIEGEYEGRPQFIVRTESATWYYGAGQRISIGFIETDEPLAVHEQVARRVTATPVFKASGEACLKRFARWTTKRRAMAPPDLAAPENRQRTCISVCNNYERRKR